MKGYKTLEVWEPLELMKTRKINRIAAICVICNQRFEYEVYHNVALELYLQGRHKHCWKCELKIMESQLLNPPEKCLTYHKRESTYGYSQKS